MLADPVSSTMGGREHEVTISRALLPVLSPERYLQRRKSSSKPALQEMLSLFYPTAENVISAKTCTGKEIKKEGRNSLQRRRTPNFAVFMNLPQYKD